MSDRFLQSPTIVEALKRLRSDNYFQILVTHIQAEGDQTVRLVAAGFVANRDWCAGRLQLLLELIDAMEGKR